MPANPYKSRPAGSLKELVTDLVNRAGTLAKAAERTRVKHSHLARYTDPAEPNVHMPVDVVLALEIQVGVPVVTRYLAHEQGYVLGHTGTGAGDVTRLPGQASTMWAEAADFSRLFAESISDGEIDKTEAGQMMVELDDLIRAAQACRDILAPIRDGQRPALRVAGGEGA